MLSTLTLLCRVDEPDLVRLERLHGGSATVNLADPALRTSSNLSSVMQHWNPIAQEVLKISLFLESFLLSKLVCFTRLFRPVMQRAQ